LSKARVRMFKPLYGLAQLSLIKAALVGGLFHFE
jgi:hypothetical protein